MANTVKFCRQQVIKQAMTLFWIQGFQATSTRMLQDATGLKPGSLYAAFGSKRGLTEEVLEYYADEMANQLDATTRQTGSFLAGLQEFFCSAIEQAKNQGNAICLLNKALTESANDGDTLIKAQCLLAATENRIATQLEQAMAVGELTSSRTAQQLAQQVQIQIMGLRSYLCANPSAEPRALVAQVFSLAALG